MVIKVVKRDGRTVAFDKSKIIEAISKAGQVDDAIKEKIASDIENLDVEANGGLLSVEDIQDIVEQKLMESSYKDVAREYVRYRYRRELIREHEALDNSILEIVTNDNEYINGENSNKNPVINSTQRDYMAGEVSKDITSRLLVPEYIWRAHQEGLIHFHDSDYFIQKMHNCCLVNLEDMLQNGTVISNTLIEKPHSFSTACNIATQIMAQVASNQYGGQSETLSHLAPFVDVSRKKIHKQVEQELEAIQERLSVDEYNKMVNDITESRVRDEVKRGVQTIQYQIMTLMTTNGQTPFVTIFMYLNEVPEGRTRDDLAMIIEEVLEQRYQGTKNEKGAWVTPAFPKLVYVLEENNIHEDSQYWYLTKLAAKCTAKRLVPDYVSEKKMFEYKKDFNGNGNCYPPMGCRSFLTPDTQDFNGNGVPKYYGRFNQGVVTVNLPDVALTALQQSSDKDDIEAVKAEFWKVFDERLELCHKALQIRHRRLEGTISDVSPIHWQHGALARLKKGEKIDKLLHGNYSTISLGYAGLYECVKAITGKSHTDEEAKPFALSIMKVMNDRCAKWKAEENVSYSLYGTPIETTTEKFAKCLQKRFGIIEGITDHDYITNSYHVNVREHINPFQKLQFEAEFQLLSPGGAISYIETGDMSNNLEAVLEVMKYIYDNIIYAELNTKSDYCQVCDYDGEIQVKKDEVTGKLIWECPQCGNRDQRKMNVARRTCGYIGSQFWGQGRTQEIKERFVHLGGNGEFE